MNSEEIENPPTFAPVDQAVGRWEKLKSQLPLGTILTGEIFWRAPFGVFYDAGVGFPVLMEVVSFGIPKPGGVIFPVDYPALGSTMTGKIVGFRDLNQQIHVVMEEANINFPSRHPA